jgi:hypothetical protein
MSTVPQEAIDVLCDADAHTTQRAVRLVRECLRLTPTGQLTQINGEPIEVLA